MPGVAFRSFRGINRTKAVPRNLPFFANLLHHEQLLIGFLAGLTSGIDLLRAARGRPGESILVRGYGDFFDVKLDVQGQHLETLNVPGFDCFVPNLRCRMLRHGDTVFRVQGDDGCDIGGNQTISVRFENRLNGVGVGAGRHFADRENPSS